MRAIAARDDVRMHLSGPGFPDWDDQSTAVENVRRIMPECDAVIGYKLAGCEYGQIKKIAELSKYVVVCERFNECYPGTDPRFGSVMHPGGGTVAQECRKARINLVAIHHANDYDRVKSVEDYGAKIVHVPHGADPVFLECAKPWSERRGVILTGSVGADHYALRVRWRNLIKSGQISGREFVRCSNYTNSVAESDALVRKYAEAIGSARVVLGCSSRWKYQLARFSEIALAGTCHVADLPDAVAPDFSRMLFTVTPDASDEHLVDAVETALEAAETIGKAAQETAAKSYTTAVYAERLVAEIRKML